MRVSVLAVLLLLSSACMGGSPGVTPGPPTPSGDEGPVAKPSIRLEPFVDGLDRPVEMVDRGDGSFLIVEQAGLVRVLRDGSVSSQPFLDLRGQVSSGGEQGLLGLALDPGYETNGRLFVDYTDRLGDTQVVRYTRLALDPDRADPLSAKKILSVDQPEENHNGGLVVFGPDGKLYIGLGDGGGIGDRHGPHGNGQNKDTLLGKILRLDVSGDAYTVPSDNPFAKGGGRGEIWAYGLRNPWRFAFDRGNGDLYIGDVGQDEVEEIDYAPHASRGGENYGWNLFEGSTHYRAGDAPDLVPPVAEYGHDGGHCSVVGGYVYRGSQSPALRGVYLYGDYCSGYVWGLWSQDGAWRNELLLKTEHMISSFAEDHAGEVYLVDHGGAIFHIDAEAPKGP